MYAHDLHVFADVLITRLALEALLAGDVRFGCHKITWLEPSDTWPCLDNFPTELVAKDHGRPDTLLGIGRPLIDVDVRAADGCGLDLHQ
jgi:hypothetical protein